MGVLEGEQSGPILKGSLFCGEESLGQKDGSVEISEEVTLVPQVRVCLDTLSFNQPSSQLCASQTEKRTFPKGGADIPALSTLLSVDMAEE